MLRLTDREAHLLRASAQRIGPRRREASTPVTPGRQGSDDGKHGLGDVLATVDAVVGVQAQDRAAGRLAFRVRASRIGLTAADVERARTEDRVIVRTWAMRGTLHVIASADWGWILPLVGPGVIRSGASRRAELGLDDETYRRGVGVALDLLDRSGEFTRPELARAMAKAGISTERQAQRHLAQRMAMEGRLVFGPDRGREPTFVPAADWLGQREELPRDEALGLLATRYLRGYGPAGVEDFATWSGLPMADARAGWRAATGDAALAPVEVEVRGRTCWAPGALLGELDDPPEKPTVRLLGAFDTYLLGYRGRDLALPAQHSKAFFVGGGMIPPAVLVDGEVVGTWRIRRRGRGLEIVLDPFEALDPDLDPAIAEEAADFGRFLGAPATWRVG